MNKDVHSLYCADVPLSNSTHTHYYSLTHSPCGRTCTSQIGMYAHQKQCNDTSAMDRRPRATTSAGSTSTSSFYISISLQYLWSYLYIPYLNICSSMRDSSKATIQSINSRSSVIEECSDDLGIANEFASTFNRACVPNSNVCHESQKS